MYIYIYINIYMYMYIYIYIFVYVYIIKSRIYYVYMCSHPLFNSNLSVYIIMCIILNYNLYIR